MTTDGPAEAVGATAELAQLRGHSNTVSNICFNPQGDRLASCSADQTLKVWNVERAECVQTFEGHERGISDVAWHPKEQYIASAADDLTLGIWDVETGSRLRTLSGHTHFVYCCKFHQDGDVVVSGSLDEAIRFWDIRSGQTVKAIPAHSDPVTSLDFVWDGTMLASASSDGLCRLWDFGTGLCLRTLMDLDSPPVTHVAFSPNGRFIMESALNHTIRIWDWQTNGGRVVRRLTGHHNSQVALQAFFIHGSCVAAGSEDGTVAVWNINSGRVVKHNVNLVADTQCPGQEQKGVQTQVDKATEGLQVADSAAQGAHVQGVARAPVGMDVHEGRNILATCQIGHPEHVIRLATIPSATS